MSNHGRTFYRCGCIRVQCRCPGPHIDTVLPIECKTHRQERREYEAAVASIFERHAELFCRLAESERADDRERLIDDRRD